METISVLVVDDEPGIAALCKRVIGRAGYDVTALTDPRAAIEHVQPVPFKQTVERVKIAVNLAQRTVAPGGCPEERLP